MTRGVLRLVLLVSCAHALVHVFEQALPSVEQEIAHELFQSDAAGGKRAMGWLSWCWRLPWGLGALIAGWLVDRFGSRRMLAIYLIGCAVACGLSASAMGFSWLAAAMISMGALASIYHPAGLALISHETDRESRPRALGLHGIFGSAGIALAPIVAAVLLTNGTGWRVYFWSLAAPGVALGLVFLAQAGRDRRPEEETKASQPSKPADAESEHVDWSSFGALTLLALLQGFVYSAVLSFLPRYLSQWEPEWGQSLGLGTSKLLAGGVLLVGCIGQYIAGRMARPDRLEWQLTGITLANAPCLIWMSLATDSDRAWAAAVFALVHFMHQPIYNSLIAKYTPPRRRSLCYGFSFAMGLGVGSFGAVFAGWSQSDLLTHGVLAAVAILACGVGLLLCVRNRTEI